MLKVNKWILKDGCAETFSRLLVRVMARSIAEASILHQISVNCLTNTLILKLFRKSFQIANPIEEDLDRSIQIQLMFVNS